MRTLKAAALALALAVAAGGVQAQTFTFGWNPRSGDTWVDVWLGDMNRYGSRYRDPFIDEMVRYHGAPRDLIDDLLRRRWAPGDIYFACALARLAGRPCRDVADMWERDHGQGWGAMAKRLGIKPGSAEFHRLKRGMVPTYDRWGRPIDLDSCSANFLAAAKARANIAATTTMTTTAIATTTMGQATAAKAKTKERAKAKTRTEP
jgi:hypothetical protein